jgi:hypothetical protein
MRALANSGKTETVGAEASKTIIRKLVVKPRG